MIKHECPDVGVTELLFPLADVHHIEFIDVGPGLAWLDTGWSHGGRVSGQVLVEIVEDRAHDMV